MDSFSVRRFANALPAVALLLVVGTMIYAFHRLPRAGVALFAYVASALVELIARGVLGDAYGHRRRRRVIERLHRHTIICCYGRVGRRVAAELRASGRDYVVVDINADAL